jgi:hypothetical protein
MRRRWRVAALVLGATSAVLVLVLVLVPRLRIKCRIERTNPYSPEAVANLMRDRDLAPNELRKVSGTRPRSVLLRSAFRGGTIIAYVRREALQDALPDRAAKELGVGPSSAAGTVNVSLYASLPPGADTEAIAAKLRQLAADLATPEVIPCSDE